MSKPKAGQPSNPLLAARKKLEEAESLRRAGKLVPAQKLCEAILKHFPDYVGALHTLGLILADRGNAVTLVESSPGTPPGLVVVRAVFRRQRNSVDGRRRPGR